MTDLENRIAWLKVFLKENEQSMNQQVSLLEKRAIDYVDKHFWYEDLNENCFNKIIKAYIAGAKEYEQLYNDMNKAYQELVNGWVTDYKELEKENEQLRAKLESTK